MVLNIAIICLTVLLGLCVGSFLNVVIYRLPNNMSLVKPASHCPNCDYKLKWYDNIPLLSYIILKGKCRNCKQKISIKYPLVEFANMALWFLALMMHTNVIFQNNSTNWVLFAVACLTFSVLICVFMCDLENMEIPDELQICLLILGVVSFLAQSIDASSRVYGFLLGGGFFALFAGLFYLIRKKEGLGFGDIKLMAVLGLLLGFKNTIITIILSSITGAIVLLVLSIKNKGEKGKEYPFATFIVPAAIIAWFVGDIISNWYLSLFA